jgi:hypothetical protein
MPPLLQSNGTCLIRDTLEEIEQLYKEREERLKAAHTDHVEELESRISSLMDRKRELMEAQRDELQEERERRKRDLVDQAGEHKDLVQVGTCSFDFRTFFILNINSSTDFEIRVHGCPRPPSRAEDRRGRS